MSLPAFEDWLYVNRKSGTGREVGGCTVRLKEVWLCLGSAAKNSLGWPLGDRFLSSFAQWAHKPVIAHTVHVGPPFLAVKLFRYQDRRSLTESHDC